MSESRPRVGLFVTCLVDAMRPNIGLACATLLEQAGCQVEVPTAQSCCGQPAFNSGDDATTRAIARQVIDTFLPYDYLVAPSGSCCGTIKCHYGELFADDPVYRDKHQQLAAKSFELLQFLHDVRGFTPQDIRYEGVATYHDTCSGLRELGILEQPRALLAAAEKLQLVPLEGHDQCCGFGGTFCVKYADVSDRIVSEKAKHIQASGADTLLGGDLGCLLNMAGKLHRLGSPVRCFHTAEVLANMADQPLCQGD